MEEKVIRCIQCGLSFSLTVAEQKRFMSKGFDLPKRCPVCRKNKIKIGNHGDRKELRNKRDIIIRSEDYGPPPRK
jgi:hypothetical protein